MYNVYAFDFDGTLTKRDTLIELIRYAKGNCGLLAGFLRFSPMLLLMKLKVYPNYKAKQKIFAHFFRSMPIEVFNETCRRFAHDRRDIIREDGIVELYRVLNEPEAHVLVMSASIDNWVRPFFELHAEPACSSFEVVGTQVEVVDGRLTGRFLTKNCYGEEKVSRIRKICPDRADYRLQAYGDSRGDREMLQWADRAYYQPFRKDCNHQAYEALRKAHYFKLWDSDEVD